VALPPSPPTRIRIPEIRVSAPITGLSLDSAHHLQVPPLDNPNLAGWYQDGVTPGDVGNAILLGHVDNQRGPAVFYGLGALHKGDTVHIDRQDHHTAVFSVDSIQVFSKSGFPDKAVYGTTTRPELRLITCGGGFDKATGHYLGNVVVFAHLVATAPDGH
jgi:sortase (surface protein transpeptidase)